MTLILRTCSHKLFARSLTSQLLMETRISSKIVTVLVQSQCAANPDMAKADVSRCPQWFTHVYTTLILSFVKMQSVQNSVAKVVSKNSPNYVFL